MWKTNETRFDFIPQMPSFTLMHLPQSLGLSDQKNICQQGYSGGQTRPTCALVPGPTQPDDESVPNKKLCLANFVSELRDRLAPQE